MKFTLSWLREHLDTEASLDDITKALTRPALLPVEYPLLHLTPAPWTPADVVGVAGLIGGIFGDGGGGEIANSALLRPIVTEIVYARPFQEAFELATIWTPDPLKAAPTVGNSAGPLSSRNSGLKSGGTSCASHASEARLRAVGKRSLPPSSA